MKTLLLLGGSAYLIPVIERAHEMDVRVVTCDFLPDNHAHAFADAYENASIIDERAVLAVARRHSVDGILSFATDPGVTVGARVAEALGLAYQGSAEAVDTLQDKSRFRAFLHDNGFNAPRHFTCRSASEALDKYARPFSRVVVKPIDSAGSKGISIADGRKDLATAVERALDYSRAGTCIVEEWIDGSGGILEADVFAIAGRMLDFILSDQLHDPESPNPIAPIGTLIPPRSGNRHYGELKSTLQRVSDVLGLRSGLFNVEARVTAEGKLYLMEMAPRGAGANIALVQQAAGDRDLIGLSIAAALGLPLVEDECRRKDGVFVHDMLHSAFLGVFEGISYEPGFRENHVVWEKVWVRPGESVDGLNGANNVFGSILLHFNNEGEYAAFSADPSAFYRVEVRAQQPSKELS